MTKYPDLLKPDFRRRVRHSSAGVSGHVQAQTRQCLSAFWPRSRAKEGALMTHQGLGWDPLRILPFVVNARSARLLLTGKF